MSKSDSRLVYSSDPKLNQLAQQKCSRCKQPSADCTCKPEEAIQLSKITVTLRIEKQGRSGKTVTIIDRLPRNEEFLKKLTTTLKKKCGAGGTYLLPVTSADTPTGGAGIIEIQGDKRDLIREVLVKEGIKSKN